MDILQKIREIYPSLTRKQKSIADYLLENPEDICYITLAQLSRQTCASELTLLRFCAKLGCSGFLELKQEFREHTQQMIRLLSAPAFFVPENASDSSAKTELLYELCRQEAGAAADFAASFQPESIIAAGGRRGCRFCRQFPAGIHHRRCPGDQEKQANLHLCP